MKTMTLATLSAVVFLTACAVPMSERNTTIVTAKKVVKGQGASDISDVFTFEGPIYVFTSFRWQPVTQHGGTQRIEVRWFNGLKEISRRTHEAIFGTPPYHVWFNTTGTALGPGECRAEIYANGRYVGQKAFTVVAK